MIRNFILVALGGAMGSMIRYGISLLAALLAWSPLWGTLTANVAGSFLIGLCMGACHNSAWQLMLTVGVCGGFTTFSTFSSQSMGLLQEGRYGVALLYMVGSVTVCLAAVMLGKMVATSAS